jgi:hypothetical protein
VSYLKVPPTRPEATRATWRYLFRCFQRKVARVSAARVCLNKARRRDAREEKRRENFFSKTKQERERKKKKRTLQHPRMAFTVFHHPSVRVPVRLERSHAVIVIGSVVHRAVSSSSSLHIFLVFFFSVGQFDEPFHVSRRHRRVFKPLCPSSYFSKRDKKKKS